MRSPIATVMLVLLMLPAFLPFAPHKIAHALYEAHVAHHGDTSHHSEALVDHSHSDANNDTFLTDEGVRHGVPTDMESYYSDFLHVDLRHADADSLVPLITLGQDIDYDVTADIAEQSRYELVSLQSRAPADTRIYDQDYSSLYLETLRLRL